MIHVFQLFEPVADSARCPGPLRSHRRIGAFIRSLSGPSVESLASHPEYAATAPLPDEAPIACEEPHIGAETGASTGASAEAGRLPVDMACCLPTVPPPPATTERAVPQPPSSRRGGKWRYMEVAQLSRQEDLQQLRSIPRDQVIFISPPGPPRRIFQMAMDSLAKDIVCAWGPPSILEALRSLIESEFHGPQQLLSQLVVDPFPLLVLLPQPRQGGETPADLESWRALPVPYDANPVGTVEPFQILEQHSVLEEQIREITKLWKAELHSSM